jgi:hypothetical protein
MRRADAELDALLDASVAERAARIAALHHQDPALAGILVRLLDAFDAGAAREGLTGAAARQLAQSAPLPAGTRIGAFVIDALLGHGGMGEVYSAHRDDGQFSQQVAIKRILDTPLLDRARAAEHLAGERALLARLNHPGLATLIDGGLDAEGFPWFAMEHIDGRRLDRYLVEVHPDYTQRFALLLQLIDAVAYAHRQLVVHGDLKPANLMVQEDGRLRVLDFGIARSLLDEAKSDRGSAATPGWSSPEQRAGTPPGTASDQYQIGLMLRALLANQLGGERTLDSSLAAAARKATLDHAHRLDRDIEHIAQRCLDPDPSNRFPDLGSLRRELLAWRDRLPLDHRRSEPLYRLRCLLRRHPLSSGLAAALALALSIGVALLAAQNRQLREAITAVEAARQTATAESIRQQQVLGFLETTLTKADPRGAAGALQSIDDMLDLAADELAIEFRDDPSLRAEVRAMLGFIALRRDRREQADALLAAAQQDTPDALRPGAAAALALFAGDVAFYRGDSEASEPLYREALAGMQGDSLRLANWRIYIRNQLINVMRLHGREAEARTLIPALIEDLESYPVRAENKAATYTFMALVEDDPQRALALHRQSYEVLAAHLGPLEATVIRRLANVAGALLYAGDVGAALQGYAEAMRRVAERGELESDYFVVPQGVYGRLLAGHGRWDEARPWLERAVRLMAQTRGTETPLYLYVQGDLLFWQVERAPSEDLLADVDGWLQRSEDKIGALHPRLRSAWLLRINLLRRMGQLDEAYAQWNAQRARDWAVSPQQALLDAQWQAIGGALLLDLGRVDEACRQLEGLENTALPGGPLVEGYAAALDLALCRTRETPQAAPDYAEARQQLAEAAGADNWRLARRPDAAENL